MPKSIFYYLKIFPFSIFILVIVLINSILLCRDGYIDINNNTIISDLFLIFNMIFLVEMVAKLLILKLANYLKDSLNILDTFINIATIL